MKNAIVLDSFALVSFFHKESGWEKILGKYNIKWVIYDSSSPLARYLMQNKNWHLIYSDKVASIFLKETPENNRLIQKYKTVKLFIDDPG